VTNAIQALERNKNANFVRGNCVF